MIVCVSYYPDRRASLPDDWLIWETTLPIPATYAQIADHAVNESWGLDVTVIQDDVRLRSRPDVDADLIVYGSGTTSHVCPRAFAANPEVWRQLQRVWQPWTGSVCHSWRPIVREYGTILNVTDHLEPVGSRHGNI